MDYKLLITGTTDNDTAVKRVCDNSNLIFFKLRYVPMYEDYKELRRLQLKIRESMNFIRYPLTIALDVSEWLGHENEEFFDITIKFLHDMCYKWNYIFTVADKTAADVTQLALKLRCHMKGELTKDSTFTDIDCLAQYLTAEYELSSSCAQMLAKVIMKKEMQPMRGYAATAALMDEIKQHSKNGSVTVRSVTQYLSSADTITAMLCGEVLTDIIKTDSFGKISIA